MSTNPRHFRQERREFIRVKSECAVTYRFLGGAAAGADEAHAGATDNISGGGLKLSGKVPNPDWLAELLTGRIAVGVEIALPDGGPPVRALTRVAWVERLEKSRRLVLGLRFREVSSEDRERIIAFIIKTQIR